MTGQNRLLVGNLSDLSALVWRDWCAVALGPEGADWEAWSGTGLADLAQLSAEDRLVLVYEPLDQAMIRAVSAGDKPSTALAAWKQQAEALLKLQRRRRRQTYLLPASAPVDQGAALCDHLRAWAGLPQSVPASDLPALPVAAPVAPLLRILAVQAAQSARQIRLLNDELAAAGFAPDFVAPDIQVLDAALGSLQDMAAAQQRCAQQSAELRVQLTDTQIRLQVALDAYDADFRDLEARRSALASAEAAARSAAEELSGLRAALAAEQDRLRQTEARLLLDSQRQSQLQGQIGAIQDVLQQESDLRNGLEQRLHQFETREPDLLAQIAALKAGLAEAQDLADVLQLDLLHLRAVLSDRDQSVVALSEERRFLEMDLAERMGQLQDYRNSTSWKVTAPLRATRRIFSRSQHD